MQTYGKAPARIGKSTGKAANNPAIKRGAVFKHEPPPELKSKPKPAGNGLINRGKRY